MIAQNEKVNYLEEPQSEIVKHIPEITRKYAMADLLFRFGSLKRSEITRIAEELYKDVNFGLEKRTLASICASAGLIDLENKKDRINLYQDPFLSHAVLLYSKDEMEFDPNWLLQPHDLNDENTTPRTLDDHLAGGGPARPLLKDLYGLNQLSIVRRDFKRGECFSLTESKGVDFAEAFESIIDKYEWKPEAKLYIGEYSKDMRLINPIFPGQEKRSGISRILPFSLK